MTIDGAPEPDVEIAARAAADELRFETRPEVRVSFPGTGKRDSRQVTRRQNIDTPVKPGRTYRSVFVATRISSRLLDSDEPAPDHRPRDDRAGETSSPGKPRARGS
jgi:hypothetical protein